MITNLVNDGLAQSNLTIEKARSEHKGIYYCTSSNKTKAKFRVKVGERDSRLTRSDEPNKGRSSDREEESTPEQRATRLPGKQYPHTSDPSPQPPNKVITIFILKKGNSSTS